MPSPVQFEEHELELTEVTFRCQQARLLFRPGDEFNRRFVSGFPLRGTVRSGLCGATRCCHCTADPAWAGPHGRSRAGQVGCGGPQGRFARGK